MDIKGEIIDSGNDKPLIGATVAVLDANGVPTGDGVITDGNGQFNIDSLNLDQPGSQVQISFLGYQKQILQPGNAQGNIYLKPESIGLNEFMITATRPLDKITNSVKKGFSQLPKWVLPSAIVLTFAIVVHLAIVKFGHAKK